jgi:hypothetical protein
VPADVTTAHAQPKLDRRVYWKSPGRRCNCNNPFAIRAASPSVARQRAVLNHASIYTRAYMTVRKCIIAQILRVQRNKKSPSAIMQACYAGLRGQSSRSSPPVRTTRLPLPDSLGFGSFRLGSAAIVRWVCLASGFALMAFNPSSTHFTT